ncbi:MAG: hypothetical protein MJ239_02240 [Bacilli bacterium]|nr:hypothetical protein [Bacilli bacterium]
MYDDCLALLKQYADSLLETQIKEKNPAFKGGFLCPSCKNIHGRSIDAIYGLSVAYKFFKDEKYLNGIFDLFSYSKNLLCTDGGLYNDLQTEWRFTTTFHEIALAETLLSMKGVLPQSLLDTIMTRIDIHARWLYKELNENSRANINYCTTNGLALLLAGKVLGKEEYIAQSKHLVDYALDHISTNGLFYGECQPHNSVTEKGCLGVDIGYNLEESLPALAKYAYISKDEKIFDKVLKLGLGHLPFILPDGAIDNSLGCRNYKWTYYGSRTCDGIIPLCLVLGNKDRRFIEATKRNVSLIAECSPDGLLYGGVNYKEHGEYPCLHHTFEHINAVAFAVDNFSKEYLDGEKVSLPSDLEFDSFIEEMNSYRLSNGRYILSVSDYDMNIPYSGHLSGGTITLLFDKKANKPIIVGSVGDYQLTESTNMQVPLDRESHLPGYPRIDTRVGNKYYSTGYYQHSTIKKDGLDFSFISKLSTRDKEELPENYSVSYSLKETGLLIKIKGEGTFIYKLPLISGELIVKKGKETETLNTFFLTPGFIMKEHHISSENGEIEIEVK